MENLPMNPPEGELPGETANPEAPKPVEELKGDVINFSGQANQVTAQTVNFKDGGIGAVRGETISVKLENGGIGAVIGQKVEAQVTNGGLGSVMAQEATVNNSSVVLLAAGRVSGDVKVLFDLRAGLLAGVAMGLVVTALRMLLGRRK